MALSAKREGIKQVPWFSLTEWHEVYKQIYSNDTEQQTKAYERLLAWKARIPKLPVGIESTLSILQVCLRDREWTPKIDSGELPISYESDLCLMYSTTIMRILNLISNIGHTKQTSLYEIAKQINIPEWIVNLRHDTAHAYELPSIGMLRIAINTLLTWFHEEYWSGEFVALQKYYATEKLKYEAQEAEELQVIKDLMEVWTAINLYTYAGHTLVSDIPDPELRGTIQDLHTLLMDASEQNNGNSSGDQGHSVKTTSENIKKDESYSLDAAQMIILSEIARYLKKKNLPRRMDMFLNTLLNSEMFMANENMLSFFKQETCKNLDVIPKEMLKFWKNIISIIEEMDMLEPLIKRLLKFVYNDNENKQLRSVASMWICTILYSFVKLDKAQNLLQSMECSKKKLSISKINDKIDRAHPVYKPVFWWDISCVIPHLLTNPEFIEKIVLNPNQFSLKFIPPLLELSGLNLNRKCFNHILELARKYVHGSAKIERPSNMNNVEINIAGKNYFTREDFSQLIDSEKIAEHKDDKTESTNHLLSVDEKIRNENWRTMQGTYEWVSCPFGILPWQIDSLEKLEALDAKVSKCSASILESEIIPGFIENNNLKTQGQINWDNVLRRPKRQKRRSEKRRSLNVVNKALEMAKKQK